MNEVPANVCGQGGILQDIVQCGELLDGEVVLEEDKVVYVVCLWWECFEEWVVGHAERAIE